MLGYGARSSVPGSGADSLPWRRGGHEGSSVGRAPALAREVWGYAEDLRRPLIPIVEEMAQVLGPSACPRYTPALLYDAAPPP